MTTTAVGQDVYLLNMRALWRRDARLAQRLDDLPADAVLERIPSRAGPSTARVQTAEGRAIFLHSRYDPEKEAREFCDTLEFDDSACIVLCGLGLGYAAKELARRFDESRILVGEPDLVTIKSALETTDLSAEIADKRIEFLTQNDIAYLHEKLRADWSTMMLGTQIVAPAVSREHNAAFHATFRQSMTDFAAFARMSIMTLVRNAGITCRNIANNLPAYVATPTLDILRKRFTGLPAILVAAGPSMAKNVDQLRSIGDSAIIIAAQTTLRPLLERGIRPHFVTSLDYSELSRQFFDGLDIPDDVVLVAEPKAAWPVVDTFRGDKPAGARKLILLDNPFAHRCLSEPLARRAGLEAGATVMHLAFYLAEWMGCDPIIFIGQDLAFTGHCYYSPGMAVHKAWEAEGGRYSTIEMKEWERIVRNRNILRRVKDQEGRSIYTDEQMFTYLQQFERDFARCAARVIDATEGGAKKARTESMPLADAIARHCSRPIDELRFDYLKSNWSDSTRLKPAREALAVRVGEVDAFRELCVETLALLRTLRGLIDRPAEFNRRLVRLDELRTLVQRHDLIHHMVREVSQLAELQRMAADRRIDPDAPDQKNRALRQLDRDARFIEALLEGCDRLANILNGAKERFDAAIESAGGITQ